MSSCNFCEQNLKLQLLEDTTLAVVPEGVIPFNVNKMQFKNNCFMVK